MPGLPQGSAYGYLLGGLGYQRAETQHPGDDAQRGHRQAGEAGDLRVALRPGGPSPRPFRAIINEIAEVGPIVS
jgi:hypothetical protein